MDVEPITDPRTRTALPVQEVPLVVGQVRVVAGEIATLCRAMSLDCTSAEGREQAARLYQQALRLGQAATALSAVPLEKDALLWVAPKLTRWQKLKLAGRLLRALAT